MCRFIPNHLQKREQLRAARPARIGEKDLSSCRCLLPQLPAAQKTDNKPQQGLDKQVQIVTRP